MEKPVKLSDMAREKWTPRKGYRSSSESWDEDVGYYVKMPIPTRRNSKFVKFVTDSYKFKGNETVLDIGCGAGQYSVALSKMASRVVGIDFSGNMIDAAKTIAAENGADNVEFYKKDWKAMDLSDPLLKEGFDVVFAHTTPAIGCADAFEFMLNAAKKACFYSVPVRRTDHVMNNIWSMLGHNRDTASGMVYDDDVILYAFLLAWEKGLNPIMLYETGMVWDEKRPLKSVMEGCRTAAMKYGGFTAEEDRKALSHLESLADGNGMVPTRTDVQIANMFLDLE